MAKGRAEVRNEIIGKTLQEKRPVSHGSFLLTLLLLIR